jgi:galactokinase
MHPGTAAIGSQPVKTTISAALRAEIDALKAQFDEAFVDRPTGGPNRRTHVVRAPGRVNLIGEHTDYNDGYVFPMAIESEVRMVCRGRDDGLVRIRSTAYPGQVVEFSVQRTIEPGEPAWADYCRGVAAQLRSAGIPLTGMDALLHNTLPMGAGLSSSAAVEVATALGFLTLAGLDMDPQRIALLCQKAEHEFPKVPCGIMDQTIVAGGRAGHAMLLDCRDLSKQHIAIDPRELRVVIVNSMARHALTGGEYRERREQCEKGLAYFRSIKPGVRALRDVAASDLAAAELRLDQLTFRRCRHVIGEIARTVRAAERLAQRDYDTVGQLMFDSHASLRDDFEVSTPELDALVEIAASVRGVYGARMTGAGFGGCIVALVQPRAVDALKEQLLPAYAERTGKTAEMYLTDATAGAGVIE